MFENIIAALGLSKASAVAGAVGALIATLRQKGAHWIQRVIFFLVGFCVALYVPKLIIVIFKLPEDSSFYAGFGFVFGYFGPALLDAGQDAMDKLKTVDWAGILTGWIKKG